MPEPTTHPSRAELSAYNLGQLPPDQAAAIENHISECEPCCETIIGMSSDDTFVALLQEARQLPTDQTLDLDGSTPPPSSSLPDVPAPLAEHPRYEIVGLIGRGGMGDVYKARHRKMERTVALKVINRGLVRKTEAVDRFHREVKAAAHLSHPNIVTAHDADQAGDHHFMVMEYVDGVDLSQTVRDRGALPVAEACAYIRQAAIGLQHAHERGMVHRDIKPHNLMVTIDGTVKILDFGLASLAPEVLPDADTVDARGDLTAAGSIMGTPDFISPEQADDAHQADIRSDIYSLGTTLYFLLSGRAPFADGSVMEKLKSHAQVDPEPLESLRDDIPAGLAAVVGRMIAKDPGDRYQTPAEVAEALSPYAAASPAAPSATKPATEPHPTAAQPTKVPPRRGPFVAAALAGLALALVAAAVFYIQLGKTTLRFEVSDPSVKVSFAGETIGVGTPDNSTFRIEPSTEQKFVVYQDETEVETDSLTLRRGQKVVLTIDVVEGQIEIASNDRSVDVNRTNTTPKLAGQHEDPASDREKIQGTWQAVYSADSGRVAPPEMLKNLKFVFTQDSLTMDVGERKAEGTYRLEPSTTPKSIDFTTDGETKLAIYELREDTLQICLPEGRQGERPTAFESKPDSVNDVLIMLRRVDPGENLENQRDKIKGMWRVVSYEDDGRSLQYWKNIRLKIDLGVTQAIFTWYAGEKGDQELMTVYRLDPDGNAGWIDEDDEDGSRGIYELEGDTLRICKADERPTEYESKPGSTLIVLKRDTQQLSDAAAMELIPEAASITNDDRLPNYGIKTVLGDDGKWRKSPLDPQQQAEAKSAARQVANPETGRFDLQYVPAESTWVTGACAAELLKSPAFDKLKTADIFHPELSTLSRANQVLWLKFPLGQNPSGGDVVMITVKDDEASHVAELMWQRAATGETRTIGGRTVQEAGEAGYGYVFLDEQTVAYADFGSLDEYLSLLSRGKSSDELRPVFASVQHGQAFVIANTRTIGPLETQKQADPANPFRPLMMGFAPIWQDTEFLSAALTLGDGGALRITAHCGNAEKADSVAKALQAVPVFVSNILNSMLAGDQASPTGYLEIVDSEALRALAAALEIAEITPRNDRVGLTIPLDDFDAHLSRMVTSFVDDIASETAAALQAFCRHSVKQIAMGLDRYKLDNGTYPSTEEGLKALTEQPADQDRAKNWDGPYLLMPLEDPWDNEFQYAFPGTRCGDETRPDIWSLGPDGKDDTKDDIGNWEPKADGEGSDPRTILDQGCTIIDCDNAIGSRQLVVSKQTQIQRR